MGSLPRSSDTSCILPDFVDRALSVINGVGFSKFLPLLSQHLAMILKHIYTNMHTYLQTNMYLK